MAVYLQRCLIGYKVSLPFPFNTLRVSETAQENVCLRNTLVDLLPDNPPKLSKMGFA